MSEPTTHAVNLPVSFFACDRKPTKGRKPMQCCIRARTNRDRKQHGGQRISAKQFPHGWGALSAAVPYTNRASKEEVMAGKDGSVDAVYKVVEVIGTSAKSWEDAARNAVETAAKTLRDLRI